MDDQNKNLILAAVLSFMVILTWSLLFPGTDKTVPPADQTTASATATDQSGGTATTADQAAAPAAPSTPTAPQSAAAAPGGAAAVAPDSAAALADAPRVPVKTPSLTGTISLLGGRVDDLSLVKYHETLDPNSPLVRQLSPVGSDKAYYALYGWSAGAGLSPDAVPGPSTLWTLEAGTELTPTTPIKLMWDNGAGLIFHRTFSVDDNYMFSVEQSVENRTASPVSLAAYGIIARHGKPATQSFYILHEGVVRMEDGKLEEITYKKLPDLPAATAGGGVAESIDVKSDGWLGFTDKYWMTTLVPQPGDSFTSTIRYNKATDIYQAESVFPTQTVAPGGTAQAQSMLFAGAKEWETIRHYQDNLGIKGFIDSIDWGWFFFLTKPIFWLLHTLNGFIGNMGWSIVALTITLKAIVLPLAYKSYVSMAKMKELQPQMEELRKNAGDDKQAVQMGMMKLYKDNKVNPASGCLPILIQIPIFFSLYKVIFVTIELRHAPWIGWIRDLSAPDPSSILNFFGLLPFAAPAANSPLHIISLGVLPIFLGLSMWLQQKLNPAPTDATQKMVFAWMPWVFMFMLGSFASGLVLYWITNNTITFTQQYLIMRSHGHSPDVFGNIRASLRRKPATAGATAAANKPSKPGQKK
ncbi:MAG: membrane protein insertase YidC [Limimaricola sp.]|uniref:membrane protein insertase YidC n=1 Tax=Limimaricola sp. TaxID=2211665 RepID=UPI001D7126CA|nr:membrane protein insertase YidC [Limimaricola sp.]MBI1415628.1 membrane protein insertase YidC [Limimaricola sp.]